MTRAHCLLATIVLTGFAATGCNRPENTVPPPAANDAPRNERTADAQPFTVIGCLQKQDRLMDRYILTPNTRPANAPVASGGAASIEREQMRQAMKSYDLKGMHGDLEKLVGTEVRITGTLDEASTLADAAAPSGSTGTAGAVRNAPADIDVSDLAAIDVQRVEQIAPQCEVANK